MGRQAQLVCCNVVGFWVIGTFTGYMLAFKAKLGVSGLWLGINAGVLACGESAGISSGLLEEIYDRRSQCIVWQNGRAI